VDFTLVGTNYYTNEGGKWFVVLNKIINAGLPQRRCCINGKSKRQETNAIMVLVFCRSNPSHIFDAITDVLERDLVANQLVAAW
jgi:hypothetical protein